ncbi:MAG: hypothetical protein ACK4K0_10345 [Flavobacteriales bacterium]
MKIGRFLIASLISMLVMLGMSYTWHGVILTDFKMVNYPFPVFIGMLCLLYLVTGLVVSFLANVFHDKENRAFRQITAGVALGFFVYLIAFTLGVTFKGDGLQHVVIDFIWQMLEQGTGVFVAGLVYKLAEQRDKFIAMTREIE